MRPHGHAHQAIVVIVLDPLAVEAWIRLHAEPVGPIRPCTSGRGPRCCACRFLEERTRLPPGDPWFARLRDAYLEPWGRDLGDAFALAVRVGSFARAIAYRRQRAALPPEERALFDTDFSTVLRRAAAQTLGSAGS